MKVNIRWEEKEKEKLEKNGQVEKVCDRGNGIKESTTHMTDKRNEKKMRTNYVKFNNNNNTNLICFTAVSYKE